MVDPTLLIALVIIALTQMVKLAFPQINGWLTIFIAFVVGILISVLSFVLPTEVIGIERLSIGGALIASLTAIGITVAAGKAGGGSPGDETKLTR